MSQVTLGIHRLHDDVIMPKFGTPEAACFDIHAYIKEDQPIMGYGPGYVGKAQFDPKNNLKDTETGAYVEITKANRLLIPTGIIFDIPVGYSLRLHSRSGLALKEGIVLANGEGVIDSDYHHETFVMLTSMARDRYRIYHGDRIAQAELVPVINTNFEDVGHPSKTRKTERTGGFGSTGA